MFLIIGERNHKVIRHIHISHNAPHLPPPPPPPAQILYNL